MLLYKTYRVVLFGHRDFNEHKMLEEQLSPLLKKLIKTKPFVEIYIGRNGEFDLYTATIVKSVQKETGRENNELICVLPYRQKDIEYYEKYYDTVIIPECIEKNILKGQLQDVIGGWWNKPTSFYVMSNAKTVVLTTL